jgi:hypothetical protein
MSTAFSEMGGDDKKPKIVVDVLVNLSVDTDAEMW